MTQDQSSKFNMIERAVKFVKDNIATVATNPAFQADFNLLESQYNEMLRLTKRIESDSGHTSKPRAIIPALVVCLFCVCPPSDSMSFVRRSISLYWLSNRLKSAWKAGFVAIVAVLSLTNLTARSIMLNLLICSCVITLLILEIQKLLIIYHA